MSTSNRLAYSIAVGVGVTMISGISYLYYKYYKKDVMPLKWRRVGTLAELYLFPTKSCAPLTINNSNTEISCELLGLRLESVRDRCLMLIDDKNQMITARTYPKMVLVKSKMLNGTTLELTAPDMPAIELNFATLANEAPGKDVSTTVYSSKLNAMLCGEKYDKWFSKYILEKDEGLHLVYYAYPDPVKNIDPKMLKNEKYITKQDTGTFSDATSYMLMNLASITDLNKRLKNPVTPLQFRGNLYLKMDNDEPYAENNWNWIKIGDNAVFRNVAPCTRCIFPNIKVENGHRDPDFEPLRTLKTYRIGPKYPAPMLGIHMGLRQPGAIKLNDIVYVEDN